MFSRLDGNIDDDDEIPVAVDVGPVVRGCSNSAKIRLSCGLAYMHRKMRDRSSIIICFFFQLIFLFGQIVGFIKTANGTRLCVNRICERKKFE